MHVCETDTCGWNCWLDDGRPTKDVRQNFGDAGVVDGEGPCTCIEHAACRAEPDDSPLHNVQTNEHLDAWCGNCGERLLLPGYAGGPQAAALDPEIYGWNPAPIRCHRCGEGFQFDEWGFAERAEVVVEDRHVLVHVECYLANTDTYALA